MSEKSRELPVQLTIFGFRPSVTRMEVVHRPRSVRLTRSLLILAAFWGAAPIVLLVPPHIEWALGALIAGVYYARKNWLSEYIVQSFEGECPSCGSMLKVDEGATIRFPHDLTCYECHHRPSLEPARLDGVAA